MEIVGLLVLGLIVILIVWASNANKKNKMEIKKMNRAPEINYNDELLKLVTLKEKGAITEEEYNKKKEKLDKHKDGVYIKDLESLNLAKERGQITQEEYLVLMKKY